MEYASGQTVDGDLVRSWPSFRSLISINWLLPTAANAPAFVVVHPFKIGRDYLKDEIISGDIVRTWPTFDHLLAIAWIIAAPAGTVAPKPAVKTARPRQPAKAAV